MMAFPLTGWLLQCDVMLLGSEEHYQHATINHHGMAHSNQLDHINLHVAGAQR
jgi:hypothetical protein